MIHSHPMRKSWTASVPRKCYLRIMRTPPRTISLVVFERAVRNSREQKQSLLIGPSRCQDDITRCLESHMFDPQFQDKVNRWHKACDNRLTTSMTTPPVTSLTTTYDMRACERLHGSCMSAEYETNKCSHTYLPTSSLSYLSCACQPSVYSLMSECQYNGNISCKRTTAAESNIVGYSVCSYFWSGSVSKMSHMHSVSAY